MIVHHITRRFTRESWGGTESAVLGLAMQLKAHGHETKIQTSMALANSRCEEISGTEVERFNHFYPYLGLSKSAKYQLDLRAGNLFSFPWLGSLLKSSPPDLYHLHTGKRLGGIVRVAARHHRKPYVISLHGGVVHVPTEERQSWTEPTSGSWEWGRLLGAATGARRVLQDAAAILCVNRAEQATLQQRFPEKRIAWTPNSIDVQHYSRGCGQRFRRQHRIPGEAHVILNVARVDAQKDQLGTLRIFEQVAASVPDTWLIFAGATTSTDYARKLDDAIALSPFRHRVLCLGNVDASSQALLDVYHAANVFLLNSIHEPFGIVLLEAWAAGLPIVAPRVGGIPSFVEDGVTGLLFDRGQDAVAVSSVIQLLQNSPFALSLAQRALREVQAFDHARGFQRILSVYEEVQREYPLCA